MKKLEQQNFQMRKVFLEKESNRRLIKKIKRHRKTMAHAQVENGDNEFYQMLFNPEDHVKDENESFENV